MEDIKTTMDWEVTTVREVTEATIAPGGTEATEVMAETEV